MFSTFLNRILNNQFPIRNEINRFFLCMQALKDIKHIYGDFAGYDMSYDEFQEKCRRAWKEDFNYLHFDRPTIENEEKCRNFKENKNASIDRTPESLPFAFHGSYMLYSKRNRDDLKSLKELESLQYHAEYLRLQGNLGKQNSQEVTIKVFELVTDTVKDQSGDVRRTILDTSSAGFKSIANVNEIFLDLLNDRGINSQKNSSIN